MRISMHHTVVLAVAAGLCLLPTQGVTQSKDLQAQLVEDAQRELAGPYQAAPFNCLDPWLAGPDGVVAALPPWASAAGLRMGDTLRKIQGLPVNGPDYWIAAMRALPSGLSYFDVEVMRASQVHTIRLPCRSHLPYYQAERRRLLAASRRDWKGCVAASEDVLSAFGATVSPPLSMAVLCASADGQGDKASQYGYQYGVAAIHEMSVLPAAQRATSREILIAMIQQLDDAGYKYLAADLHTRLNAQPESAEPTIPEAQTATSGTGFLVTPDGLLLTALHVVDGAKRITARCGTSSAISAALVTKSSALDLALLRLRNVSAVAGYLDLAPDDDLPPLGARVFTVGFPVSDLLGPDPKYTDGTISALSGLDGDAGFYQVSVPIQPGNSGGPLLDERGRVVGVVLATASAPAFLRATGSLPQNINWAVKARVATPLFKASPLRPPVSDRQAAINRATAAACLIVASRN